MSVSRILFLALVGLPLLGLPADSGAMCCPIPCIDCELESQGQLNLVVMDRDANRIRLIPNIRVTGVAEDFALIVPTPTVPGFQPVSGDIWSEAIELTAPMQSQRSGDGGLDCGGTLSPQRGDPTATSEDSGVSVIGRETVGGFIATIITSDDPDALIDWLNANSFSLDPADADKFAPYVERNWVFTTMKLDPSVEAPPAWDISVDPVEISYPAAELEVPLPILSINRAASFPMVFFVVDEHRTELTGFQTTYGNRISDREGRSIAASYPSLAPYVRSGTFLTRLDRRFENVDPMDESILLAQARTDSEFRRVLGASAPGSLPGGLVLMVGSLLAARYLVRRRYAAV